MKIRIAVITDAHAVSKPLNENLRGEIAHILLLRAVKRLNRWIKPDVTLFLGDIVHSLDERFPDGESKDGPMLRHHLRGIIDLLDCPVIILPGNHDSDEKAFYKDFPRPSEYVDIKGFRFVCFNDPEMPLFNACRTDRDLERMAQARSDYTGPIIALQHVSLFPVGSTECPYNFTNAAEVITFMKKHNIFLSISGHFHAGCELIRTNEPSFITGPSLAEHPFSFLQIDIDGPDIRTTRHQLAMPAELQLVDCHIHTPLAHCSENMDIRKTLDLAEDFNLAGLCFTEHTGALYYDEEFFFSGAIAEKGIGAAQPEDNRMDQYFAQFDNVNSARMGVGLEVDTDANGSLVLYDGDRARAEFLLGSIHFMPEFRQPHLEYEKFCEKFLFLTQKMLNSGIDILAHPFRLFYLNGLEIDPSLYEAVVGMLRQAKVAAEINFHNQQTTVEFAELCLKAGVKMTLGSDSHSLDQIGELGPHLRLLKDCGYNGDLKDILLKPRNITP